MSGTQTPAGATMMVSASSLGGSLMQILMADDIQPGSDVSYQLCKILYLYHPLGQKMAEGPINIAQSQKRDIVVPGAPERVLEAFLDEWDKIGAEKIIHNVMTLARVYGIASVVLGAEKRESDTPLDPEKLADEQIFFNVLDPLNTSGSLVLSQQPNAPDFQKHTDITASGVTYHRSRVCVVMNEQPVYIAYTSSSFGYVGRSVYQRALFPLKTFVQSMITDDMVTKKAGLLVAKMKAPGSIVDRMMTSLVGLKRQLLKQAETGNVLGIGVDESIETLNMQNLDSAAGFARNNLLKNIATAADMPAKILDNETLVSGFGEGTEDARNIARYIDRVREQMQPLYGFFDNIVQWRAWNPQFYKTIQREFPETYRRKSYKEAVYEWRDAFAAQWPSLLIEPESQQVQTDDVKLRAIIATLQVLLPELDPDNKAIVVQWAADNIGESKILFPNPLNLDLESLRDYVPPAPLAEPRPSAPFSSHDSAGGRLRIAAHGT